MKKRSRCWLLVVSCWSRCMVIFSNFSETVVLFSWTAQQHKNKVAFSHKYYKLKFRYGFTKFYKTYFLLFTTKFKNTPANQLNYENTKINSTFHFAPSFFTKENSNRFFLNLKGSKQLCLLFFYFLFFSFWIEAKNTLLIGLKNRSRVPFFKGFYLEEPEEWLVRNTL